MPRAYNFFSSASLSNSLPSISSASIRLRRAFSLLQFFELLGLIDLQHAELPLPAVERLLADLMTSADIQGSSCRSDPPHARSESSAPSCVACLSSPGPFQLDQANLSGGAVLGISTTGIALGEISRAMLPFEVNPKQFQIKSLFFVGQITQHLCDSFR